MTKDRMRELLGELISIRSDESEEEHTRFLKSLTEGYGASAHIEEVAPGRFNFTAIFVGKLPGKSWLFEAHGDTVPGKQPYRWDESTGRVYGRGACDNKAALVAMLAGIVRARETGMLRGTVQLASTCREETGGEGARALAASAYRPDLTIIGEPTRLEIVRAHKGAWRTRITTHGKAVHSSNPKAGINAIVLMCDIIRVLENEFAPTLARIPHALLGAPTLSVGTIQGGRAANVVPDQCTIEVDWRLVPGMKTEELLADLRNRFPGATVEQYEFYPPFHEADDSETLARLRTAIGAVLGKPAVLTSAPWAANAGILQHETGQSCVIFGPGDIAQAHTVDEWIEWRQVEMAAEIYERLLTT